MDNELFERLLYEEESTTLDFKKEQYRFVKATDVEKSELLKDIVGFANAWRRSMAYILIGVQETRGGQSYVVGITEHLDDHSLQQFVNNLTNQPVRFHYKAFNFRGKQVGVISIDEQTRPIYLRRDYGKLRKDKVYVRRGSSTDPTKPASLEEIAQMRVGSTQQKTELTVEFADVERDHLLGNNLSWQTEFCCMPSQDTIPDLKEPRSSSYMYMPDLRNNINRNYFRQIAKFEFCRRFFRPLRLVVKNVSQVAANNVQVEIILNKSHRIFASDECDIPKRPERYMDYLMNPILRGLKPAFRREPGEVTIDSNDERFRIVIDCGSLQPGRRVWSDIFYLGKGGSGEIPLSGLIFADNLPQPQNFMITIQVAVEETHMTVEELCSRR